ncbi:MAG: acyltransferase [Acidimicrobiales bacterium]|nr:acyltransferase [Acidimicrobiales bacterium]
MRSGYRLHQAYTRARDKFVSTLVRGAFASFGSHSVLAHPVRLGGVERIRIGSGVYIGAASWLQVVDPEPGGEPQPDIVIDIGDNVRMSGMCVISGAARIRIEEGALLARNVYVADHGHAFTADDIAIHEQGISSVEPVRVGAGAWLGQNVVLLPGADIGRGSIIGANSVVRGTVPDRSVAVGAPARVVRSLDDD